MVKGIGLVFVFAHYRDFVIVGYFVGKIRSGYTALCKIGRIVVRKRLKVS